MNATRSPSRLGVARFLAPFAAFAPQAAFASFLSGEALDTAADVLAIVVLIFVPIGVIYLFWLVHILPEEIAEKRQHPQKAAIKTLCLLSLVFGGMLWPLAWIWAYTRPIGYKLAYGTEKHEDFYKEEAEKVLKGEIKVEQITHIREELDALAEKGTLSAELKRIRKELAALEGDGAPVPAKKGGR